MADIEKVTMALELCKYDPDPGQTLKHIHSCAHCPYWNDGIMPECAMMYTDAIELLKEQEETIAAYAGLLIKYGYEFK